MNFYDDVICQCGKDVLYDKFNDEVVYDIGGLLEFFWRREVGVQQLQQYVDGDESNYIGYVMENGCYCCDGELNCLQIQIDRFLFFYIFYYE